ncbi:unnamed protein product, partial [Rotaria sp. Silwood2]
MLYFISFRPLLILFSQDLSRTG